MISIPSWCVSPPDSKSWCQRYYCNRTMCIASRSLAFDATNPSQPCISIGVFCGWETISAFDVQLPFQLTYFSLSLSFSRISTPLNLSGRLVKSGNRFLRLTNNTDFNLLSETSPFFCNLLAFKSCNAWPTVWSWWPCQETGIWRSILVSIIQFALCYKSMKFLNSFPSFDPFDPFGGSQTSTSSTSQSSGSSSFSPLFVCL